MFDPQNLQIAVAFMKFDHNRLLLSWNDNWQSFVLPMTKVVSGPIAETAEHAAIRAASEALHLPTRVVPGKTEHVIRQLQLSNRDGEIKDYHFTVVPVEVHPDFQSASLETRPVIFASIDKLQSGEYQPLSNSVKPILDSCVKSGWL